MCCPSPRRSRKRCVPSLDAHPCLVHHNVTDRTTQHVLAGRGPRRDRGGTTVSAPQKYISLARVEAEALSYPVSSAASRVIPSARNVLPLFHKHPIRPHCTIRVTPVGTISHMSHRCEL